MSIKTKDFKSFAYTIPPPGHMRDTILYPPTANSMPCKAQNCALRSGGELNPRIAVLQTAALATSPPDRTKEIVAGILTQIKLLYNVVYEDRHL